MTALERATQRKYEQAARYAAADRSDPFTLARCQAHIRSRNGVSGASGIAGQRANVEPFTWCGTQSYRYRVTMANGTKDVVASSAEDARIKASPSGVKVTKVVRLASVGTPRMERITCEPFAEYNAEPYTEVRHLPGKDGVLGEAYHVTVYRNIVRP